MVASLIWAAGTAVTLAGISQAIASTGFKSCAALVNAGLGDSLVLPAGMGNAYSSALETYYSLTVREMQPYCILQPRTAKEVSAAVKALAPLDGAGDWHIAVRSGGHGHWGGNNVHNGVTIDLSYMNKTTLSVNSYNQTIAHIDAGSRWDKVLNATEEKGYVVTAGRIGSVGVAGFALGGGTSFLLAERGFACNDVVNYEVVLADGSIVYANNKENPMLFRALKGGGANFGIVTRFDMATIPSRVMYGGIMFIDWSYRAQLVDNLIKVIDTNEENPANSIIVMYTYNAGSDSPAMGTIPMNLDGDENSLPFIGLGNVTNPTLDLRMKQTYGELTAMMQDHGGSRYAWHALCFHNDVRIFDKAEELFSSMYEDANNAFPNGNWSMNFVFQPLPKHVARIGEDDNVLGLRNTLTHNAVLFAGESTHATRAQESWFNAKQAAINAQLEEYSKSINADIPFRYLPYAASSQDPISTYGEENIALIREVAEEYDPSGFFQYRVNGGFKISRVAK